MILASLGVAIAAVAVFMVFFYQPTLTVIPTPGDATVTLDGQTISAGTPLKLDPGAYTLLIAADGYLSTKMTVRLRISQILSVPIELRRIPSVEMLVGGVRSPALATDEAGIVYLGKDGQQFFRVETAIGPDGKARVAPITPERFSDVVTVAWSPDRELAIIQKTDGTTNLFDFKRYDFLHQEERTLESNLRAVAWHPTEPVIIAFKSTPDGERSLINYNIRSGKTERLIDLRTTGLTSPALTWSPDGRTVALVENQVTLFDVANRALKTLPNTEGAGGVRWRPESNALLVEKNGTLEVIPVGEKVGGVDQPLRSTLAKAAWTTDGGALIVATATDREQDRLERIDLISGQRAVYIYAADHPIAAENLLPAADAKKLWFASAGTLHSLVLEEEILEIEN